MALREFRDARGVEWRVWATTPESAAPLRFGERALGELEGGWLTFECADCRRRLAPFPADWDTLTDAELERWCSEAKAPPARRAARVAGGSAEPSPARATPDLTALDPSAPARTFTGSSGRMWRVVEHEIAVQGGPASRATARTVKHFVLRFTSESEVLELRTYPMAWARLDDAQLIKLARQAERVR